MPIVKFEFSVRTLFNFSILSALIGWYACQNLYCYTPFEETKTLKSKNSSQTKLWVDFEISHAILPKSLAQDILDSSADTFIPSCARRCYTTGLIHFFPIRSELAFAPTFLCSLRFVKCRFFVKKSSCTPAQLQELSDVACFPACALTSI